MILSLFKRNSATAAARTLYGEIVAQARQPGFYGPDGGVADTEDGRYDMILLHVFLVLERLNRVSPEPKDLKTSIAVSEKWASATKVCGGAFRKWLKDSTVA